MTKAPIIRKYLRPTGQWVSDADLRHDAAIKLGCPTPHGGPAVNVNILTKDLRETQKQLGGSLVVDGDLIKQLYIVWVGHQYQFQEVPEAVYHTDYPGSFFLVRIYATKRTMSKDRLIDKMGQAHIPGPVQFILFFRVPTSKSLGEIIKQ